MSHSSNEGGAGTFKVDDPNMQFILDAFKGQFLQMNRALEAMNDKLERHDKELKGKGPQHQTESSSKKGQIPLTHNQSNSHLEFENEDEEHGETYNWRGGRLEHGRERLRLGGRNARNTTYEEEEREVFDDKIDGNLGNIKLKIPPFRGRNDAEEYLEWERKVEMIFDCNRYSEEKKVKIAAVEFTDYALFWWDQLGLSRRKARRRPISNWEDMKEAMRKRFVPSHYFRELHQKLHRLVQGAKSVEDYHKDMEMCMVRANIEEDEEVTMARFLGGLNKDIADAIELYKYDSMEDMLNMAMKIEKQKKNKSSNRFASNTSNSWGSKWPMREEKKGFQSAKPKGADSGHRIGDSTSNSNSKGTSSTTPSRDIKCFKCLGKGHIASQCPNKRVIVVRNGYEYSESEEKEENPYLENCEDSEDERGEQEVVVAPETGHSLVARRVLNMQLQEESLEQRENIFHTRCLVGGKVCTLIIDSGSCTNVASLSMVSKLNLKCEKHPKPYKLQWFNDLGSVKVNKQVVVPLSIGPYVPNLELKTLILHFKC